jgi:hypothetical protein
LALLGVILYCDGMAEEEMSTEDRRAPGTTRLPFDGLVEVGGAMGPAFEAQAVDVSEDGMKLRTAYLPEAGQPLTCRFDAGAGSSVLASGEVVWAQGEEKGGEFAIRFTDMDSESVEALKRMVGVSAEPPALAQPGSKVRLHIEGLASPMRAKIKDAHSSEITVGSDLGFLQVGKQLELEDATSGSKRPAAIDRVEVAVDPTSNVPQLVVTLRYADVPADVDAPRGSRAPAEAKSADDPVSPEEISNMMKGSVARSFSKIGPAVEAFAKRAKTTVALLAARRSLRGDEAAPPRRTTAPAPGGGLHTSGRKVVRGEASSANIETGAPSKLPVTRRKAAIAGGVMAVAVLGAIVLKKSHHDPVASAAAANANAPATTAVAGDTAPAAPAPAPISGTPSPALDTSPSFGGTSEPMGGLAVSDEDPGDSPKDKHRKHGHVAPFGNGPVHHGNVLHLKLDGPIDSIEGAQQPTGFAVKIPGRKSLEAAGPLAARDSRIAAIKVSNDSAGAELTVNFKDGVPNYQVRAQNDTLVIALAPAGALEKTVASTESKGGKSHKHAKHDHKKPDAK